MDHMERSRVSIASPQRDPLLLWIIPHVLFHPMILQSEFYQSDSVGSSNKSSFHDTALMH